MLLIDELNFQIHTLIPNTWKKPLDCNLNLKDQPKKWNLKVIDVLLEIKVTGGKKLLASELNLKNNISDFNLLILVLKLSLKKELIFILSIIYV